MLYKIFIRKSNMKKVIRLTESDLTRIVKRVIRETEEGSQEEGKCMNTKRTAQKVGTNYDHKLVYDLKMIKPVGLQNKIKNAGSKTGFVDTGEGEIILWASSSWDWNNIGRSLLSLPFGEKLGEFKPGPKFLKLWDSMGYQVEWKYENNKLIFYFIEEPYGC